jgi:hypothetical protein
MAKIEDGPLATWAADIALQLHSWSLEGGLKVSTSLLPEEPLSSGG